MQSHIDVLRHLATQTAPKSVKEVIGLSLSREQGLHSGLAEFEGNAPRILAELASEVAKSCSAVSAIISEQSSRVDELTRVIGSVQQKIAITQLHTSSRIGNIFREKISYWPEPCERMLTPTEQAHILPPHPHYTPHRLCMSSLDHIGAIAPPSADEDASKPYGKPCPSLADYL